MSVDRRHSARHRTRQRDFELTAGQGPREAARLEKHRARPLDGSHDARDLRRLGIPATARAPVRELLGVDTGQAVEKSPDVMPPPQLSIGHDRETGLFLLDDREADRVVLGLLQLGTRHAPRRFQHVGRGEPRWLRQASDDGRFEHGCSRYLVTTTDMSRR